MFNKYSSYLVPAKDPRLKALSHLMAIGIPYPEEIELIDPILVYYYAIIINNLYKASILTQDNWNWISKFQVDLKIYAYIIDKLTINDLLTQKNFEFILHYEKIDDLCRITQALFNTKLLNYENFEWLKKQADLKNIIIATNDLNEVRLLTQSYFQLIKTRSDFIYICSSINNLTQEKLLSAENLQYLIKHDSIRNLATAIHELYMSKILNPFTFNAIKSQACHQSMASNLKILHFHRLLIPENVNTLKHHSQLGILGQILGLLSDARLLNQQIFTMITCQFELRKTYKIIQSYHFKAKLTSKNLIAILSNPHANKEHIEIHKPEAPIEISTLKLPISPILEIRPFYLPRELDFRFFFQLEYLSAHRFASANDQKTYDKAYGLTIYSPKK